ncbi:MAG: 6-aminohexanoate hydrolase [Rhodobacterales bacterium]|nr:MAG: 6-aminohexanoate hydrolase [Rhodobacterales bacterium]PIE06396.1 MAG: 6-aminohexanoate hydrolase [Rhodobacterales bacterium]
MFKRIFFALVVIITALGVFNYDNIRRLLAVNSLFAEDRIADNFISMDSMFFSTPMELGPVRQPPLPEAETPLTMPPGFAEWAAERKVSALVALRHGEVVYEEYFHGDAQDLRISWSVAKSFIATLFGISLANGEIASLDDPVEKYAPKLIGSAYEGATIRNVLNMASGVEFDEDYHDFWSDINKMGRVLAFGGSLDDFAAAIETRIAPPGRQWQYVSIDTHVIGMVLRGATGRTVPDLLADRLLAPIGIQKDPYYLTDGDGVAFVLGGLNLRTRDYARLGQLVLQNGMWNGVQVVPADWIAAMTTASAPTAEGASQYGYQWWLPADARPGEVFGIGVYGQYIWIDRAHDLVIAVNSANRSFSEDGVWEDNIEMFRKIGAALTP